SWPGCSPPKSRQPRLSRPGIEARAVAASASDAALGAARRAGVPPGSSRVILPQAGFETPALIAQQPLETHEPGVLSRSHRHDALHPAQNDVAAFQTMGSKCPVREGSEGDLRPPVLRRDALLA